MAAAHPQSVFDVGRTLGFRQRVEVVARSDALIQLPQFGAVENVDQLRLADEKDLKQLLRVGLQVGQQPDLLEHVEAEILCFVDEHDGPAASSMGLQQIVVQGITQHLHAPRPLRVDDVQFVAQGLHQLDGIESRVQNQGHVHVIRQLLQQGVAQRRLARADLAGKGHEPTPLPNAVEQVGQSFLVPTAEVEETRVRGDREREIIQVKVTGVHRGIRLPAGRMKGRSSPACAPG